jgi:hypothetical protein
MQIYIHKKLSMTNILTILTKLLLLSLPIITKIQKLLLLSFALKYETIFISNIYNSQIKPPITKYHINKKISIINQLSEYFLIISSS